MPDDYSKYPRGSQWRKWDLHLHTPGTKKSDQFEGANLQEQWGKYIKAINESDEEIAVVGITDYFCIENYFKFKSAVAAGRITKKFDLILPNIELRVTPVTGSSTPINLHCIFNPDIENDIENRFLAKLKFNYGDSDFSAKKGELIRLGKSLPGNGNINDEVALIKGVGQYVISADTLRKVFEEDPLLRENTIIVVSNKSTDGNSGIIKHEDFFISKTESQLDATRWSIYQFSDAIFSSNEKDVLYFLGLGIDNKKIVLEKCKTLMPCLHGCDAHTNEKIFKPSENRFCWIKADPTFGGLKQTIYEPMDRVKIQTLKPEIKNQRYLIDSMNFIDSENLFNSRKIYLNENLNCIIGGKSAGKSLLLYSAAKSIDPDQVNKASKRLSFEGYKFGSDFNFEVAWKNGDKDFLNEIDLAKKIHKITYIPQLYINYLVEKNNKDELNALIKNILLQDDDFKIFFDKQSHLITVINNEIEKLLTSYLQIRTKGLELQLKSKELGKSETIQNGILMLKSAIEKGQKDANLTKEEAESFSNLNNSKSENENAYKLLSDKDSILSRIAEEINFTRTQLFGAYDEGLNYKSNGSIDVLLDEFPEAPHDITAIRNQLELDYDIMITNLKTGVTSLGIEDNKKKLVDRLGKIKADLLPHLTKLAGQNELRKLTTSLEVENGKYLQAQNYEKQLATIASDYSNTRKQIASKLEKREEIYRELANHINTTKNMIGPEISLTSTLIYKKDNFLLFEQANKASIKGDSAFYDLFDEDLVKFDLLPTFFLNPIRAIEDKLNVSADLSIPLKQKVSLEAVLRGLITDAFELDYSVTYKGDDLLEMSPGKKGTVLLILFLQISSAEFPIFIDQPEDNLDNRTIYDLLCKMIKQKKQERQIIIVSHNANLVVATDSENIIIANQEGQGTQLPDDCTRFDYVSGSLEYSFPVKPGINSILFQQGIREHVCDILEGGDEAFKQRERKYAIK